MVNYRVDPFTGVVSPALLTENLVVPSAGKPYVKLKEFPLKNVPTSILIRDNSATTTVNPDQDCVVRQDTGANLDDASLVFGRTNVLGGGWLWRTFLRFNISALPSNPDKVLLRLYILTVTGDSPTQTAGIYRVTSSWTETGPTWAAQPTIDPTLMGAFSIAPSTDGKSTFYDGWYETDVTALYNLWKSGTNNGLMVKGDESVYSFVTSQSRTGSPAPQLVCIANGALYQEVGQTVTPGTKQFAVAYDHGMIRFNPAAAGLTLPCDYKGLGSVIDSQDVIVRGGTTSGSSTAYTVTVNDLITLNSELIVQVKMHATCGNSPTLNLNSTGAKPIYKDGAAVTSGQLANGVIYFFSFDGTNYQVK
jgi:hypothetical protein